MFVYLVFVYLVFVYLMGPLSVAPVQGPGRRLGLRRGSWGVASPGMRTFSSSFTITRCDVRLIKQTCSRTDNEQTLNKH